MVALRTFRSFDAGEVELQKDLTVVVVETTAARATPSMQFGC
jgi:hypothetical protein